MAQRSCIFCDNPATTLEHVWPRWILTLLPERRPTRQKLMDGPKVTFNGDFKIKCACATCNNGWMSEIECESQFVVKPLVQGISILLEPKHQELLSRWVIKTAIVMEGVKPQDVPRFFDSRTRKQFMESGTLPANTSIWIGRTLEPGLFSNGANFSYRDNETGEAVSASVTTMVLGQLVIQTLSVERPSADANGILQLPMRASNWHLSLLQVQPVGKITISWPPTHSFHNMGGPLSLSQLKYRWNPDDDGSSEPRL